jgi:2-desacetyl-2-hydroxyethyl bacteriochlorophyllide A dehydrogenase
LQRFKIQLHSNSNVKAVAKVRKEPGVEVIDTSPDPVGENQVRLKMRAASICGSDLGFYDFTPAYERFAKVPIVMGHEFAGEVSEVGGKVGAYKEGDRVSCESVIYCGTCPNCRSGRTNICENFKVFGMQVNGGFSEYVTADSRFIHSLPDDLGFVEAGVVEPLSVVVNALTDVARPGHWKNAAIVGPGPLGLLSGEVLRAMGVSDTLVVGISIDEIRLGIAKKLGHAVVNSSESDAFEASKSFTGGRGFEVVVVAAGAPAALRTGLLIASKGGQVVVLGIFPEEVPLPISDAVRRQVSIAGSYGSSWIHYERAIRLLSAGKVRAKEIVTHQFRLDQAKEAFETAKSRTGCKVEFLSGP